MCDNKNELHKSEKDKSKRNTSTRLDLDITDTTDTYPEFDFLDLLRNLQVENKKAKKLPNEESTNKSNSFSDESELEYLARYYDEKYANDYEFDVDGYDEDDSFIDNSDAVIENIPNGIRTELGGFYINRGKLSLIREEDSSSSVSEDVDKFLSQKRLVVKRTALLDEDSDEKPKESGKNPANTLSSNHVSNKPNNSSVSNNVHNNSTANNANSSVNCSSDVGNGTIKSRKRSGEFHHKSKKNRKTATPKIPDHLIHRKPFSGSSEFRKNISEIKKNRMKSLEAERKTVSSDLISADNPSTSTNISTATTTSITVTTTTTATSTITTINKNSNNCNNVSNKNSNNKSNHNVSEVNNTNNCNSTNGNNNNHNSNNSNSNSNNNNNNNDHLNHYFNSKKEVTIKKKAATVKEMLKDRDAASEVIEAVATGADLCSKNDGDSSSDSETSETSNSDSGSESSDEKSSEKRKPTSRPETETQRNASPNGIVNEDFTAKNFAHLNDSLKSLIGEIVEISKEEKTKLSNSKLNSLLLRIDIRLRELPAFERSAVLDYLAVILQLKKESITKKTKKLLFIQEENKMAVPLRKLKETVADMMPALESNYLKEFTKATGTSGVEPVSLPQRKFPWTNELRSYLREIIKHRENCYHIVRPRKESLSDYVKNFLKTKLIPFWPQDWMTVDILWEEGKVSSPGNEEKNKVANKLHPVQNSSNASQKKVLGNLHNAAAGNKKPNMPSGTQLDGPKPASNVNKNSEVKSILIPRKVPQNAGNATKPNYPSPSGSSLQSNNSAKCFQLPTNKNCSQEYFDKMSSHINMTNRNSNQQLPASKSQQPPPQQQQQQQQQSVNRLVRPGSCSTAQSSGRPSTVRTTSPNSGNKSVPYRNCNNSQQNVYKTIEIHSKPVAGSKSVGNSVTISPVTESMLKDISSSPEILNLTKNPSVCISKITDCQESKFNRSGSPSVNRPLPSGITISPTNAMSSNFLAKQKKPVEKSSENRINVSITKQESGVNLAKEKRKSVLNMNVKREGPLQNIPDCISVTSNVVASEKFNKVEHVRKRAMQEYHEQQQQQQQQQQQPHQPHHPHQLSPERLKIEEKKIKLEENFLTDIDIREDKLDDKNFSKIFDSVIAKTSENVNHGDELDSQIIPERYPGLDSDMFMNSNLPVYCSSGFSQFKNKAPNLRDVRVGKEKPYSLVKSETSTVHISDEKRIDDCDDHSEKEIQVQKEMDRVMQNLVELSNQRVKDSDYDLESHYSSTAPPPPPPPPRSQSTFQVFPKMLYK
ncbi:UNVERIFIED_CONTAM: hypothetical protein PYX00_006042 [Menopon gallinae]|uniref:Ubinuclein n=1 Tax=Menopon gallinae TaxID=328185 RepID=A0AAW2HU15_9NEOP